MISCILSCFVFPESSETSNFKRHQMHQNQSGRFTSIIITHQKSAGIFRLRPKTEQNNNCPVAQTKSYQIASEFLCVSSCKSSHWKALISSGSLGGEHMLPGWLRACPFPATLPLLLLSSTPSFQHFFFILLAYSHSHFSWVERAADKEDVKTFRLSDFHPVPDSPKRKIIVMAKV